MTYSEAVNLFDEGFVVDVIFFLDFSKAFDVVIIVLF